jgi:hypothetical protein
MPESDATPARDGLGTQHELWLAMRSAHDRYQSASAALDALTAMSPAGVASPERTLQIEAAASEQRAAFESYIEARLQLSEYVLSKQSPQPPKTTTSQDTADDLIGELVGEPKFSRGVILAVLAAFLLPSAFGLGYLIHAHKQTRDLAAARDAANAALEETRNEVQKLTRRVEQLKGASPPTVRTASRLVPPARGKPSVQGASKPGSAPIAKNHNELVQLAKRGDRTYREFTLTPVKHSERVGPVGLTVLKVDPQRRYFDLSITAANLTPQRKRVNLYQQVWISLNGRPNAVELVVNRIDEERVQGYVSEPKYPRMSSRRVDDGGVAGALACDGPCDETRSVTAGEHTPQ